MNVKVTWGVCILYDVHENDVRPVSCMICPRSPLFPSFPIHNPLSLTFKIGRWGSWKWHPPPPLPSPRLNIETFHIPFPSLSSLMQTGHTDRPKFGRLSLEIESATVLVISYIYSWNIEVFVPTSKLNGAYVLLQFSTLINSVWLFEQ